MKTVIIPLTLWRILALEEYPPRSNFVEVMKEKYGLIRFVDDDIIVDSHRGLVKYEIVNKQKYMIFCLEWGEYL